MGIRWTGSQGQLERRRRRQSRQQRENQAEPESPVRSDEAERPQTKWFKFGVSLRKWAIEVGRPLVKVVGLVVLVAFGLYLAIAAFDAWRTYQNDQDNKGQIEHDHVTPVWIQGDWLVGEYRQCEMRTKTVPEQDKDLDSLDKLPRLFCAADSNGLFDFQSEFEPSLHNAQAPKPGFMYFVGVTASELDDDFHVLPVRYWGRIDRTDKWVIDWRCQRMSASLECKAPDGTETGKQKWQQ